MSNIAKIKPLLGLTLVAHIYGKLHQFLINFWSY